MLLPPSPTNACVKFPVLRTNVWSPRPKDPKSMVTCLHAVSTTLRCPRVGRIISMRSVSPVTFWPSARSEEHTSELQSQSNLVCRLLLEKKNNQDSNTSPCTNLFGHMTSADHI